ncbi:MAG: protein arginine kinase [Bacillota bacterium]|nr:protein arginine kinase [Bacillota bacterium]
MENWIMSKNSDESNLVLSSRIRLARNIDKVPFPIRIDEEKGKELIKDVENVFYISPEIKEDYITNYLWNLDEVTDNSFLEKHLISPRLINNYKKSAFILNKDQTVSIMLNEEDHIRLQCITAGLNLEEAFKDANKLDDIIEDKLNYAFDENLGYLTACPTNLGTGLRASVMIHLPVLSMSKEITQLYNAVTQIGMTIRGLYGEGSNADGNVYQISNQISLGVTEEEIINNINAVVNQIINQENIAREHLLKNRKYELEDKIFRSLGILKSAVLMNSKECLSLLSNVRMGIEMGIINDISSQTINELFVSLQPATLQLLVNKKLNDKERDLERAKLIREKLK